MQDYFKIATNNSAARKFGNS